MANTIGTLHQSCGNHTAKILLFNPLVTTGEDYRLQAAEEARFSFPNLLEKRKYIGAIVLFTVSCIRTRYSSNSRSHTSLCFAPTNTSFAQTTSKPGNWISCSVNPNGSTIPPSNNASRSIRKLVRGSVTGRSGHTFETSAILPRKPSAN